MNEVTVLKNNSFENIVYLTNEHINRFSALGKGYWIDNGRIYTELEGTEEFPGLETEPMNDPLYCLEHNC